MRLWRRDSATKELEVKVAPPNVVATNSITVKTVRLYAASRFGIVGESYRQDTIRRVVVTARYARDFIGELDERQRDRAETDSRRLWFRALIIREPDNPHDQNAIAVYAEGSGHVGYFARHAEAIEYQSVMAKIAAIGADVGTCPAYVTGGVEGAEHFGVVVCLSRPSRVLRDLNERFPT